MEIELAPYQYAALYNPFEHFYFCAGVASGKTFVGSQFTTNCIEDNPGGTGLIGANTHDQLSQATLRELFYWLDEHKYDYVVDQRPPHSWGMRRELKTYKNVMVIRAKTHSEHSLVFTRVMSQPNPLRGIEISWYWLDETRDTPQSTHDVVLSRMRESKKFRKGMITSTPNGEDWAYQRFVRNLRKGQRMYGAMHIETIESVKAGIIPPEYYNTMLQSYSPLMAQQELFAKHVNVTGGRAYYAASPENRSHQSPWGTWYPDVNSPLIVGCDFNYAPAPCVWMVGQIGTGQWSHHIHWFGEISKNEASTPEMTQTLINRYPGFLYRIFGDSSGKRGTTSNAGQHDYNQIAATMQDNNCVVTMDVDQFNPHVKDRVENMNRMFKNAIGEISMTYNPSECPLFDADTKTVGWKQTIHQGGRGKLDDGGDKTRTHATDGAGYAVWKLFPPGMRAYQMENIVSPYSADGAY